LRRSGSVKRPEPHIIASEADAIFRRAFAEWAVCPQVPDYGVDYIVRVSRDNQQTGYSFNAQLKGSRNTKKSADGRFILQALKRGAADYLARQLRQPTFLFHADVIDQELFWSAIQLDQKVIDALGGGNAKSLTVRIPTANVLQCGLERFLIDLEQSEKVIARRINAENGHTVLYDGFTNYPRSGFHFSSRAVVPWHTDNPDEVADLLVATPPGGRSLALLFLPNDTHTYYEKNPPAGYLPANAGIIRMSQQMLAEVKRAPAFGYKFHYFPPELGAVYCVRTWDGQHFAKITVTDVASEGIAFDWAYQSSGSPLFE
jgi:hypothetical protein